MIICAERQKLLDCKAHAVVIGGPGSGKTTIALKKAVVRIQAGLLPGQNVLFLSFSRNAVARVLQVARLELSREGRALLHVSTFHAFFWELLKTHGYLLGAPSPLKILMPQDEKVRNGGIKDDDDEWDAWLASREQIFHAEGLIAFDLFAPKAAELLSRGAWIPKLIQQLFPLIIVDEAQDTGPDAWRCIELLAAGSQIICLADLEQQIFDHLPGIGPERLDAIKAALKPTEVDLGSQNLRSPGSQIAEFGQDIIAGRVRPGGYKGVSNMPFSPKADLHATLRTALSCLQKQVHAEKQAWAETIAILVPNAKEATAVSAALNSGAKPIQHKLMFDEDEARLAARFAAYLLEPRETTPLIKQLEEALSLLHELRRAGGAKGDAARLLKWSVGCKTGKISSAGLVKEVQKLLATLTTSGFVGDPARDWSSVKASLRASGEPLLQTVAGHLDYLVAFNRGKRIGAGLSGVWEQTSSYAGARVILDNALAQDLILNGVDDPDGIQVMTIHKAKGKQFDGVIVLRRQRHDGKQVMSNFIWRDDAAPYRKSRKILMVAVTRARVHTMLVQQVWPECPLTRGYTLDSAYK
jgi:DNA helicase II / ATP-dependent DNA helicase PcrA